MLEGKALELFNEWLTKKSGMKFSERELFYNNRMTPSMQFGVIQDFADSMNYLISIEFYNYGTEWDYIITRTRGQRETIYSPKEYDSRYQARTAAIEKLNELLNK